jgi:hypothetical protein
MLGKLYEIEPPEWATGSIGLVLIAAAVGSSVASERRKLRQSRQIAFAK